MGLFIRKMRCTALAFAFVIIAEPLYLIGDEPPFSQELELGMLAEATNEEAEEKNPGNVKAASRGGGRIETSPIPEVDQKIMIAKVIDGQIQAFRFLDPSKAYYAYTSSDFQQLIELDTFKMFAMKNRILSRHKAFVVNHFTFKGHVANVHGSFTAVDGRIVPIEFDLVLESKGWKIRRINIGVLEEKRSRF